MQESVLEPRSPVQQAPFIGEQRDSSTTPDHATSSPMGGEGYLTQLSARLNNSPRVQAITQMRRAINTSPRVQALAPIASPAGSPAQRCGSCGQSHDASVGAPSTAVAAQRMEESTSNRTGLPDNLKSGVESLSGISLDNVAVHYNSSKPAQLNAHAYAQGTDIHVAPGQEQHLPHEAWHVAQQAQGRVQPTMQLKDSVPVNDDEGLEREADVMGAKALQFAGNAISSQAQPGLPMQQKVIQRRKVGMFGLEGEVLKERFQIIDYGNSDLMKSKDIILEEYKLGTLDEMLDVTLDNEVVIPAEKSRTGRITRSFTVEFIQKPVDVLLEDQSSLIKAATAWDAAKAFWVSHLSHNAETELKNRESKVDLEVKLLELEIELEDQNEALKLDPTNRDLQAKILKLQKSMEDTGLEIELEQLALGDTTPMIKSKSALDGRFVRQDLWEGGQFKGIEDEAVSHTENPVEKHTLDWTQLGVSGINAQSADPDLSIQMTAGSTLEALQQAYLSTGKILTTGKKPTSEDWESLKTKQPGDENQIATAQVMALIKVIISYLQATRPEPKDKQRYAKEYMPLMLRTSLDAVYGTMTKKAQRKFDALVSRYLKGAKDLGADLANRFAKACKEEVRPQDPLFKKTVTKESTDSITVQDMLLSIIGHELVTEEGGIEGESAQKLKPLESIEQGDIFSKSGLAGISEISSDADTETLERFKINKRDEMMKDVKGVIFESRSAKTRKLSEMPGVVLSLAETLKKVNDLEPKVK
jgi:hypothetical protein